MQSTDVCNAPQCERKIEYKAKQLCAPHYKRQWRDGNLGETPIAKPRRKPTPAIDHADGTRTCQDCGARKDLTTGYHSDKKSEGGRRKTCKECRTARELERYDSNPELYKQKVRDFRQNNIAHVRARETEYYTQNRAARIESAVKYHHERRARINELPVDKGISVSALRKRDGADCHFCSTQLDFKRRRKPGERPGNLATIEHLTPIARGGSHTWGNCALACWRCNATKGTKTEAEFMEMLHVVE